MDDQAIPRDSSSRVLIPDLAVPPQRHAAARKTVLAGMAFATTWRIVVLSYGPADGLSPVCQAYLDQIDAEMSPYRPDSDLSRFNQAPDWSFVALPPVMMEVMRHALNIAHISNGAFDPTLLSAVELWGFGARVVPPGLPEAAEIAELQQRRHDWRDLIWQADGLIRPKGVRLDLCAIAKGFAIDGLMQILQETPGICGALVEVGGELKGWGVQPDGLPWWVEIEDLSLPTRIALCDMAVATSGESRRAFVHNGQVFSHSIDAETQAPTRSAISSVTVLDPLCWRADALATALMVMGEDRALAFAARHTIPCLLRLRDGREILSPALESWLE